MKARIDANELALPNAVPGGDAELLAHAPVAVASLLRVADLQRVVAANELVVDLVDQQGLVRLRRVVVVAGVVAVHPTSVDGWRHRGCAVVVREEDDVDTWATVLSVLRERVGGDGGGQEGGNGGNGELEHRDGGERMESLVKEDALYGCLVERETW